MSGALVAACGTDSLALCGQLGCARTAFASWRSESACTPLARQLQCSGLQSHLVHVCCCTRPRLLLPFHAPGPSPRCSTANGTVRPQVGLKGVVHITGGGMPENIPRVIPKGLGVAIRDGSWPMPELFKWLQATGNVPTDDMRRTFNLGVGITMVVDKEQVGQLGLQMQLAVNV